MADRERRGFLGGLGERIAGGLVAGPVGLLMGPQAFQGIRDSRERREMENRMLRDSIAAQDQFVDLLGRQVPGYLPGKTIPEFLPENGEEVGAPGMQLPGRRVMQPEIATPDGQMKAMQLIARMSPEGAAKVADAILPGSSQRSTAAIKEMTQFGYPMTQEGFKQYQQDRGGSGNPIEEALAFALLQQRQGEIDAAAREEEREGTERSREEQEFVNNLQISGDSLIQLGRVNDRLASREGLQGYLARPGLPFGQLRRDIASAYSPEVAADIDSFNSLSNQIAISRLSTEGFDGNTNARFSAFTATKPTFQAVGPANSLTIRKNLEAILLADSARGGVLSPNLRAKYEREVERLRQTTGGGQETRTVTLPDGREVYNVPANVTDERVFQMMQGR